MFELLGKPARSKTCEAIQGLNAEMAEVLEDFRTARRGRRLDRRRAGGRALRDRRYGTLKTWAGQLGMTDAAQLLEATLAEEKKTDALLTQLAERSVNPQAGEEDDGESTKPAQGERGQQAQVAQAR